MTIKAREYGKRGRENIAVLMQQLHVSSPPRPATKKTTNPGNEKPTTTLNINTREPLGPADANAQTKKTTARIQAESRKTKRQSLLSKEQPIIKIADMGNAMSRYLKPLLSLKDVNPVVLNFDSWAATWSGCCRFQKLAQGAFGAVYRIESKMQPGAFTIGKLIPLQSKSGWGCKTRDFTSVRSAANEVFFLSTLDEIDGFAQFRKAEVLCGRLPACLLAASKNFDKMTDETTQRFQQACAYPDQLWLFIEMSDAGIDLETALKKDHPSRNGSILQGITRDRYLSVILARDIFWQVASTLAVAEQKLEFEHRDLHLGNICLSTPRNKVETDGGFELWTDKPSVNVTIIDYTLSRAKPADSETVFNNLSNFPEIFRGKGNSQYDVYRKMKSLADKQDKSWESYMPSTNVLWLNHILEMLLESAALARQSPEHIQLWQTLNELKTNLGGPHPSFSSAQEVVARCEMGTSVSRSLNEYAGTTDIVKQPFEISCWNV